MKYLFLFFLIFLSINCKNKTTTTENNPSISKEVVSSDHTDIIFDPSLTPDEWIYTIWLNQFGEHPEELLGFVNLASLGEDAYELFFVIKNIEKTSYYTLIRNDSGTYDLSEIPTAANSWINTYGQSSFANVYIYELIEKDINFDGIKELLVATEINGMTEAADGMRPFKKVQFDVFSVAQNKVTHNEALTTEFNEINGVKINEDSNLSVHEFLSQKYYMPISTDYEQEKIEMLLNDMDVLTQNMNNLENEFQPVRKKSDGKFVVDLGLNFYECYFIPHKNNFEIYELDSYDYPIFYRSDHGIEVSRILNIKVEGVQVAINLEKIYHQDEHTNAYDTEPEPSFYLYFQHIAGKWVLQYEKNYLMMKKDSESLMVIDSNEGQ
ncbi:hypothetical protein [Leptobacterium sp. I13]|uniref:hypothetical protein n=1 Tax=Leptobacterium meishanense TaxID=3128904 RepID=UPI0030EC48B3